MKEQDNTKEYISLGEAAKKSPYSQEYLSLRARQGKLKSIKLGRNWATKQEWVDEYIDSMENKGDYLSLSEAAKKSPYSQEYLSLRARQGKLKAIKQGKKWLIKQEWVDEYISLMDEYREDTIKKSDQEQELIIESKELIVESKELITEPKEFIKDKEIKDTVLPVKYNFALTATMAFLVLFSSYIIAGGGIDQIIEDFNLSNSELAISFKEGVNDISYKISNGESGLSLVYELNEYAIDPTLLSYDNTVWEETASVFSSYFSWLGDELKDNIKGIRESIQD